MAEQANQHSIENAAMRSFVEWRHDGSTVFAWGVLPPGEIPSWYALVNLWDHSNGKPWRVDLERYVAKEIL